MENRDLRFAAFAAGLLLAAGVALVAAPVPPGWTSDYRLWLLLAAVVVSEILAVMVSTSGSMSLAYPLFVATSVLFGPIGGGLAGVASMVPTVFSRPRMGTAKFLFNLGQVVLTASLPGWVYIGLHGRLLTVTALDSHDFPGLVLPLLLAATVGVLVNFLLSSIALRLLYDTPLRRSWTESFLWMIPSQLALGLVGLAIAQVVAVLGAGGFALFAMPLVVARQVHQRYVALKDAYSGTIRSLVAAIEAKDRYTKGHSVRVARFAVAVAQSMALGDQVVQRIEYAALLHDLGKVGISRAVLSKPGALTGPEYEQIRQHPDIGARILESVPFLDDVRPIVQGHHGRVDGGGYGLGLRGDQMSLEARILAVADSYDAMTAERPYRAAMSAKDAITELRANSGTQFDSAVVEALIAAIPALDAAREAGASEASEGGLTGA